MFTLPTHPTLCHPRTREPLVALGRTRRGLIWPVMGGDGTDDPPKDPKPADPKPEFDFPENTAIAEMTAEQQAEYWRHKARKHEERASSRADYDDVKAKATKFDELQASQKSELDKEREAREAAERKTAEVEGRALRAEVATEKGLTTKQAARLVGSTREELEADADELLADFKSSSKKPDFGGGNRGGDVGGGTKQWTKTDLEGKSDTEIEAARKAGHLDQLMGKPT